MGTLAGLEEGISTAIGNFPGDPWVKRLSAALGESFVIKTD